MNKNKVNEALNYIASRDEDFAKSTKETSITRAAYKMLSEGGFDLEALHASGDMRAVLDALL